MRKDYMTIGSKYTATDAQKAALDKAAAALKWKAVKGLRLGAMPGMAIKAAIEQFRIPKVSHVAVGSGDAIKEHEDQTEWHPSLYGIEGHYKDEVVRLYLLDDGVACTPLLAHVYPAAEAPVHREPKAEKSASDAVTIYTRGDFMGNILRIEAKACTVEFMRFAQHPRAAFVTFIPRGKRSLRRIVAYDVPGPLIVGGWDRPVPASMTEDMPPDGSGMITSKSRYMSCDPRWQSDFDAMIDPLLGEIPVVFDFRRGYPDLCIKCKAIVGEKHYDASGRGVYCSEACAATPVEKAVWMED